MNTFVFNPVTVGSFVFFISFLIGLFGYESNVDNYYYTLFYPFIFLISGLFFTKLLNVENLKYSVSRQSSYNIVVDFFLFLFYLSVFFSSIKLLQIIYSLSAGNNLRVVERLVVFGGPLGSVLIQILPCLLFNYLLQNRHKPKVLFIILGVIGCFAIPVKTHVISSLILLFLALSLISKNSSFFSLFKKALIFLLIVLLILFLTMYFRLDGAEFSFVIEKFWLTFRHYTSFNVGNLALEFSNPYPLTFGLHTFSQVLDLTHFLTYGERFIDRNLGGGGLYSVVDGRFLIRISPGTNMAGAPTVWIWDFGLLASFLFTILYAFIIILLVKIALVLRLYILYGVSYLIGFFFFWDFDLFETRFQVVYILCFFSIILSLLNDKIYK